MCEKKHNRDSFLPRFIFLKFWVLLFFSFVFVAQNGRSAEQEESGQPFNRNIKYGSAPLMENLQEKMLSYKPIAIEDLNYDAGLLVSTEVARAQGQMSAIIDFISFSRDMSLSRDQQSYPKLQKKYQEDAEKQNVSIKNPEELTKYLRDRAWKAIFEKPTLMNYLRELREKSDTLIDFAKKLISQRSSLLEHNKLQNRIIEEILEENKKQQEKIEALSKESETIKEFNKLQQGQIEVLSKEKESIKGLLEKTKAEQQEKIEALFKEHESISILLGQNKLQQGQIEVLSKEKESIVELLEKEKVEQQERIDELSRENEILRASQKPNRFDKYIAPLGTVVLSALTASITTVCFLKYYRVQNH